MKPTPEEVAAMDQIARWKKNSLIADDSTPIEVQKLAASHPFWGEWLNASDPVRAACDYDFTRFVSVKNMGMFGELENYVSQHVAKQLHKVAIERERREQDKAIADAPKDDPERWHAAAERAKRTGNYPGLVA